MIKSFRDRLANFRMIVYEKITSSENTSNPANIYLLNVNTKSSKRRCEICSKLSIKTSDRCNWRCCGVFTVNFEHIPHLSLVFLLLNFNRKMFLGTDCNS